MTGFGKPSIYAHNDKAQFSLSIYSFINKLTNRHRHTAKSKQACFCWGCFLRHVRHTIVRKWSCNGCGGCQQAGTGTKIGKWLAVVVIHWFCYFLWFFNHKRTSFQSIFRSNFLMCFFPTTAMAPTNHTCMSTCSIVTI